MVQFPWVRFGEFITERKEFFTIDDFAEYRRPRVQLHGKGVILRDEVQGSELKTKRQQAARTGELLVAEIDAKAGGFGIVPPELNDAIVSSHYFLFWIDESRCLRRWLDWFIRSGMLEEQVNAQGSTNYAAIRPSHVFDYKIPLPPLAEQQRLVAHIEELARRVEEARGLRREAVEAMGALMSRATSYILDESGWELRRLESVLVESPRNGLSPQKEAEDTGRPMLRINAVSSSPTRLVDLTARKVVEVADEIARPFELRHDDVFIVRYNGDINRVAKPGIFKGINETGVVYPDKLMRLRADTSKITSDYLVFALSSRSVRAQIEEMGKTTAGQIGVSGADAKAFQIPLPPLDEQHRIVAYLDGLQAKVDDLRRLQAETQKELDALMPSVLTKAFAGEL